MPTDVQTTTNNVQSLNGRGFLTSTNATIDPMSAREQNSIELAAKVGKALERDWGIEERESHIITNTPELKSEDILETSINIFDKLINKPPAIIAHNAYATRGFIGVSQKLPISDMLCDGVELDLSYSGNELIVSHRKQSYFGIINSFASAADLDAIIKQLPTILDNNNATPYKKFIISLGDFPKEEQEQRRMLSDITKKLTKNLEKKDIDRIRLVTTAKLSPKLINEYQEKGIDLSYNAINEMVIAINPDSGKLSLMARKNATNIYQDVKKFRSNLEGLVELLENYPELIESFRSMQKDFGAYFSVYPKSNWLFSSTNPNKEAVYKLIKMGVLKEIKIDNVPSIYDLSRNSTYRDIIEISGDASAFQNIDNYELRNKQYKYGIPYQHGKLDIIVTSSAIGVIAAAVIITSTSLQKKAEGAETRNKKVLWNIAHYAISIPYLTIQCLLFSNAFADTKTGLTLSIFSPFFPPIAQLTAKCLVDKGVTNKENILLKLLNSKSYSLSHLLFASSYFSNSYFSLEDNAKAFGCSVIPYIIFDAVVNELYLRLTSKGFTHETEEQCAGNEEERIELQEITIVGNREELEHTEQLPPSSSLSILRRIQQFVTRCK